jgi:hypothetical protein
MGRVILTYKSGKTESLRCKSKEKAEEIAKKRPNVIKWNFYADNERVPQKKREVLPMPQSFEELDQMIRQKGTFY